VRRCGGSRNSGYHFQPSAQICSWGMLIGWWSYRHATSKGRSTIMGVWDHAAGEILKISFELEKEREYR